MKKKFKILAASDLHGDSSIAKKLANKAAKNDVDLVVLCGDITGLIETRDIIKPFKDKNQKVLLIPGNHETFATADFLAEFYGVKNIHGYSAKYNDVGFFGCGGADFGLNPMTEKEIFSTLKKGFENIKDQKKKIMITHMHAAETKAEFSGFEGSISIKKAVEQFKPDILISGHIHEAEGIEEKLGKTKIFNVGAEGKIIEI